MFTMRQGGGDRLLHKAILIILGLIVVVAVARYLEPRRDRHRAMREFSERSLTPVSSVIQRLGVLGPGKLGALEGDGPARGSLFADWYVDEDEASLSCSFDADWSGKSILAIHTRKLSNGLEVLLSPQDLAFVVWAAYTYGLNPHFLLGVMVAESNGDCSAVSPAGAQGCFQITYRQGAGQLQNSFPERVEDWYWAPRSSGRAAQRRTGEALGYWPRDLFIPPREYFGDVAPAYSRQLRMTHDAAATLMTSFVEGDTPVSSVANFSFGVIGSSLYFHFLNHYLYEHVDDVKIPIRKLVATRNGKSMWMAASYNQGSPRSMKALATYGVPGIWDHTRSEVSTYAAAVIDYCEQLQWGEETYGGEMTFGQFSDFLQELRWTYSGVAIDWDSLQLELARRFFPNGRIIDLQRDLIAIFGAMQEIEPRLRAEVPIVDHHLTF